MVHICNRQVSIFIVLDCFLFHMPGVALVLCQSDPVLNDGQTGSDSSRRSVLDGESKRLIEKFVAERENVEDDGDSSD